MSVITRKDIAISNNCGYNGIIKSSGNILKKQQTNTPTVTTGYIQPNNNRSLVTKHPYLTPLILILIVALEFLVPIILNFMKP